jgi:hypothetical protein
MPRQIFSIACASPQTQEFHRQITTEDHIYSKHQDTAALVYLFFDDLLGTSSTRETSINLGELSIPTNDLSYLDLPFTEEEVWSTIVTHSFYNKTEWSLYVCSRTSFHIYEQ